MQRKTVHDGRHTKFTHAIGDVIPRRIFPGEINRFLMASQVRGRQVRRAAHQFRQHIREVIEAFLADLTGCQRRRMGLQIVHIFLHILGPASRQITLHATSKLRRQFRPLLRVVSKQCIPFLLNLRAFLGRIPCGINFTRNFERGIRPLQTFTHQRHFICTQRRAVAIVAVGFIWRTKTDNRFAAQQTGLIRDAFRFTHRSIYLFWIVTINAFNDMPAVGTKTGSRIFSKPAFYVTIDRNTVIVPDSNQIAELQRSCKTTGLVGDPFHQAAITQK
ncbi:hypothetical protein ExPCM1_03506 [Escherichia coli]|nr:hypothetical protein ExPCM1_03506 [Escherichia coli]